MAGFTAGAFQNEFLPDGATDVHAIVRITATGTAQLSSGSDAGAAEVIIVDTSGSMRGRSIRRRRCRALWP